MKIHHSTISTMSASMISPSLANANVHQRRSTEARERGAIDFAHWFFPLRGGGGAVGGMLGAFKQDAGRRNRGDLKLNLNLM